jgi:hypothetical protein
LEQSKDRFAFNACLEQQDLLLRMLMGDLSVLFGVLAMLVSSRSMYFRLVMLTNVVVMCRLKMVMGGCLMMSGSSVMVLTRSVLHFFRHLNRHVNVLLQAVIRFGTEQCARCESVTACLSGV